MAKRFTDSEKWKKPFIRSMKAPYKLLWLYILDECDHAGIWQVDLEVAQIKIGEKLTLDLALQYLGAKILQIEGGEKWFIYDFIDFQYGALNPDNRAHNSVINILNKYQIDYKNKPLISPLQGAMDKDKDKDMVKDMDKDKEEAKKSKLKEHPFSDSEFFVFEEFEKQFKGTDYEVADLRLYYEKVKNWSTSKKIQLRTDWIATARNFMLSDLTENKLILKNGNKQQTSSGKSKAQEQFERITEQLRREQQDKFGNNNSGAV